VKVGLGYFGVLQEGQANNSTYTPLFMGDTDGAAIRAFVTRANNGDRPWPAIDAATRTPIVTQSSFEKAPSGAVKARYVRLYSYMQMSTEQDFKALRINEFEIFTDTP
jgi:hypothetical protein